MSKGGSSGNQTTTQQNLPSWAMNYAQDTLNMGNAYTMNPNYRPGTLDRDYSGIRGYNAQGQPNSQVGGTGLAPMPVQTMPVMPPEETTKRDPYTGKLVSQKMSQFYHGDPDGDGTFDTLLDYRPGKGFFYNGSQYSGTTVGSGDQLTQYFGDPDGDGVFNTPIEREADGFYQMQPMPVPPPTGVPRLNNGRPVPLQNQPMPVSVPDDLVEKLQQKQGRSGGRSAGDPLDSGTAATETGAYTNPFEGGADTFNINPGAGEVIPGDNANTPGAWKPEDVRKAQAGLGKMTVADGFVPFENTTTTTSSGNYFDPSQMTPFQAYDRQRFAAPSDRTTQGEGLLADRINEANPYQRAQDVAGRVANYQSGYNPAELNLTGPQANSYNNVLQGLRSSQYGNANAGLTGPQGYATGRSFQDRVQDFMNPYTDQVVNSSLRDINRARQMADLSTMGGAAKSGAFGGSREALMRAENTRNALDQAAKTSGELRSAGFNTAANLAQQEELQRLGLTASDLQNFRGFQSAGNLQGQRITAQDLQDVRGLQAEGALTAQGLGAQSDRDVMNYQQQLQRQGNQIAADQARLAEQFRQSAGALNLQGAGALGNLTKMGVDDRRQRIADLLASGGAQDARNQQDLDFIYGEFNRELDYPGRQIDLRNAAISPATGSIVTTTQPRYQQNPILGGAGAGLAAYGMTGNPYIAGGAALLSLLS